jgi:hypothetical protein
MDTSFTYEIRVEGQLDNRWADWFDGLTIRCDGSDGTILTGTLTDQAALFGVLTKIHNLNLILVSVSRQPSEISALAAQAET